MNNQTWNVLPHGPISSLAENLWIVSGDIPNMNLERIMVVARLGNGELLLHSAIAMDERHMAELESLGKPAHLVVPNGFHRLDAARYKARYPDMTVYCPTGARSRVEKVVPVDFTYLERPHPDPEDSSVVLIEYGHPRFIEGNLQVRSSDGVTAVFCDLLFNIPKGRTGLFWLFYGHLMQSWGSPKVSPASKALLTVTGLRKLYRTWLETQANSQEIVRIVPGHGDVVHKNAQEVLRSIAATL
ncbi:MAG: hypothetical protein VX519_12755 [Myxococcota bacterium]|nr:hypothetical protein [Myxococcota bacterium]